MKIDKKFCALTLQLAAVCFFLTYPAFSQTVTTIAGGYIGNGPSPLRAAFMGPQAVILDKSGNAYITERFGHRIRKITPTGTVSTYAGTGIAGFSGDNGPASSAMITHPTGITLDPMGNIVFADAGNSRVRKIVLATGVISTIAGNGIFGYNGDGGPATQAEMEQPWGVLYDKAGNLYISDIAASVVRKVNTQGTITTFAGNGVIGFSGDGGPATRASFNETTGLTVDGSGNIYISDTVNARVRAVNTSGTVNTFAGNGQNAFSGDGGPATQAAIGSPRGLSYLSGTIYIANAGKSRVRTVTGGIINTLAGSTFGYDGDGHAPLSTQFAAPAQALPFSATTVVFVDRGNDRVREMVGGIVKTAAGGYLGDGGPGTAAALVEPESIGFDGSGNLYIADAEGNRVRKVNTAGNISTVAGNSISGYTGNHGPGTLAELYFPFGVAADSHGNIFISDSGNGVVRELDSMGTITTFATNPNFFSLQTMGFDSSGNLYIADSITCVVWKIDTSANVTVAAGVEFTCGYNGDNIPATTAQLNMPYGIAFDAHGNLYIADSNNNRIRQVNTAGNISTVVGDGNCGYSGDNGPPALAEICFPEGVAIAGSTFYIGDTGNNRVRKVASNVITTYAGSGNYGYNGNNLPALSTNFDDIVAVAVDKAGTLYVADDIEALVRRIH